MRQSATCAVELAASCPTLRSGSPVPIPTLSPLAAIRHLTLSSVLVWHLLTTEQDYAWARPLLGAQKRRALELRAGLPARRGQRGSTHGYNLRERRDQEREIGAQAERAYQTLVGHWRPQPPRRTATTKAVRP